MNAGSVRRSKPSASISVALCTHNGARFLRDQVRSICLQTRPPTQIVLSDDDSSDDSVQVALAAVEECRRECPGLDVTLLVRQNRPALGVTKNFEQAASAGAGQLIALCDQDDVWPSDRLERMSAAFAADPELLLLHCDARLIDEHSRAVGGTLFHAMEVKRFELAQIHSGSAFTTFLRRNLVTGATAMFRSDLLESAAPFPVEWVHDEWLGIIAAATGRVDVLEVELLDYRQHSSNQIGARRLTIRETVQKALASRGDTHRGRLLKAELLLQRLLALGERVPPRLVVKVEGKIVHQGFRADLAVHRIERVGPIFREVLTGRYALYGRGVRGVLRDLVESA